MKSEVAAYAENLVMPKRFSAETTTCVKSGILTKKASDEIVNSLATLMLVHTSRPSPDDFTTVCKRLAEKYPALKDKVDGGYVSYMYMYSHVFFNVALCHLVEFVEDQTSYEIQEFKATSES